MHFRTSIRVGTRGTEVPRFCDKPPGGRGAGASQSKLCTAVYNSIERRERERCRTTCLLVPYFSFVVSLISTPTETPNLEIVKRGRPPDLKK